MKRITEDGEIVDVNCEDCITGIVPGPFFKTPHNHDTDAESLRTATNYTDPSKTDQSFKEDADINVIVERVIRGNQHVDIALPEHFGEMQRIDLFEAQQRIAESNATFYMLNPKIREEFQNDPRRWEKQVLKDLDSGNAENLQRMGIDIHKRPAEPQAGTPAPGATGGGGDPGKAPPEPPKKTEP